MCGFCRPTVLGSVSAFRFRLQQHILIISMRLRRQKVCRHAQTCMSAFATAPLFHQHCNTRDLKTNKKGRRRRRRRRRKKLIGHRVATVTVSFNIIVLSYNNNLRRPVSQESERLQRHKHIHTDTYTRMHTHKHTHTQLKVSCVCRGCQRPNDLFSFEISFPVCRLCDYDYDVSCCVNQNCLRKYKCSFSLQQ